MTARVRVLWNHSPSKVPDPHLDSTSGIDQRKVYKQKLHFFSFIRYFGCTEESMSKKKRKRKNNNVEQACACSPSQGIPVGWKTPFLPQLPFSNTMFHIIT